MAVCALATVARAEPLEAANRAAAWSRLGAKPTDYAATFAYVREAEAARDYDAAIAALVARHRARDRTQRKCQNIPPLRPLPSTCSTPLRAAAPERQPSAQHARSAHGTQRRTCRTRAG